MGPDSDCAGMRDRTESRRRRDAPGTLHHVTNRGVARRAIFETRAEIRFFLSLIARAVHRRWWDVHAYTVLHTHFHLLVRVRGQSLSDTMRWVLFRHARRFNLRRGREGPLFTSRFFSRPVLSSAYRRIVVGYIDRNPLAAGLTRRVAAYPYGSARAYLTDRAPRWLDRSIVDGLIHDILGRPARTGDYEVLFAGSKPHWLVERRLVAPASSADPLDDLLTAPTDRIRSWLVAKATLADGKDRRPPLVTPRAIEAAVRDAAASDPDWKVPVGSRWSPAWPCLAAGLLRDICRLMGPEIAAIRGISRSSVDRHTQRHRRLLATDQDYAGRSALVLRRALDADHAGGG